MVGLIESRSKEKLPTKDLFRACKHQGYKAYFERSGNTHETRMMIIYLTATL